MEKRWKKRRKWLIGAALCAGLLIGLCLLSRQAPSGGDKLPEMLMEEETRAFLKSGALPAFRRQQPLAEDDPLTRSGAAEEAEIPYHYGLVYASIDGEGRRDEGSGAWQGPEPAPDTGLWIGGNAASADQTGALDNDSNDFSAILPYASLKLNETAVSSDNGEIEYSFGSDCFNRNEYEAYDHTNVHVVGEEKTLTRYQQMTDDVRYSVVTGEPYLKNLSGIIYTGGVRKTVLDSSGQLTETVVKNEGGAPLFTVRYKNAILDRNNRAFDLVLRFIQITFVAEEEVTGPFSIMEGNRLCLSPLLYQNGHFLVGINAPGNHGESEQQGIRIGARYEFDYSVEDAEGRPAEGLLFYSMRDLDEPSMASRLETDAGWSLNGEGNDYRWAEGFGIADGAASFALRPYYNHSFVDADGQPWMDPMGDPCLLHVSRMAGVPADGTANGLMFTAANVRTADDGGRDDDNTYDTGFAALIKPQGSMVATMSSDRFRSTEMTLFSSYNSFQLSQSAESGGRIYAMNATLEGDAGAFVENDSRITVLARGGSIEYIVKAKPGYSLLALDLDGQLIPEHRIKWVRQEADDGSTAYRSEDEYQGQTLIRDESGAVHVAFRDVNQNHSIHAKFAPAIWKLPSRLRLIRLRGRTQVLLAALCCAFVFIADVLWMLWKKPSGNGKKE